MRQTLQFLLCACFLPALSLELSGQLSTIVHRAETAGARTALYVADLDSTKRLFGYRETLLVKPASNQKVLTMAAVLEGLGQDFEFVTQFRLRSGVLEVLAAGDPNWNLGGSCDPNAAFARVAEALKEQGVSRIRSVRLLKGTFTGPDRPRGWTRSDAGRHYGAATGGLVLEAGCFQARITPGRGANASVKLVAPAIWLPTRGKLALTNQKKRGGRYHLALNQGTLRLGGHYYRRAGAQTVTGIVDDPAQLFRITLEQVLRKHGVTLDLAAPARTCVVCEERSYLRDALPRILKESKNHPTEQCLRVLGSVKAGDGSFSASLSALRDQLAKLATLPEGLVLDDGSGLSHDNRVTAKLLVDVLCAAARRPYRDLFVRSLAIGGVDGTMKKRFKKGPLVRRVRGKTGTISGVSTLCGYVQTPSGQLRAFAILMHRVGKKGASVTQMRRWQDEMVTAFAKAGP